MAYMPQTTDSFIDVLSQSFYSNSLNPNLKYDPVSTSATILEAYKTALAATDGTSASMYAAGEKWLQTGLDYYKNVAVTASANAAATGNRIQANIARIADNMAQRIATEATDLRNAAANSADSAASAVAIARVAQAAGAILSVAQIIETASSTPDTDQATVDTLHTTAEAVGSMAGGYWGAELALVALAAMGITGFPAIAAIAIVAGVVGYGIGKGAGALYDALIFSLQQQFASAAAAAVRYDPLTLDLDGDGIETVAGTAGAHFDHDANGFAEQSGWVGKDDGLLVWDRNGNGRIDSGRELFGDQTLLKTGQLAANGFAALAEWDGNGDGKIDAGDAVWANLQVWKDADGDGVTDAGELHALNEIGITALNLANTATNVADGLGNTRTQLGSFTKGDNTAGQMGNYVFSRDTARTVATTQLQLSADIAALPDLAGFGNVHDLSQAMMRDTTGTLKARLQAFTQATEPATRATAFENLLFTWAGASGIAANSRGGSMDARRLAVLEAFLGQGFVGQNGANPNAAAVTSLNQAYQSLTDMFQARLMAQTFYKPLFDAIGLTWNAAGNSLELDVSSLVATLKADYAANTSAGTAKLLDFAANLKTMGDFGGQVLDKLRAAGNLGGADFDLLLGCAGRALIQGDANANTLTGAASLNRNHAANDPAWRRAA